MKQDNGSENLCCYIQDHSLALPGYLVGQCLHTVSYKCVTLMYSDNQGSGQQCCYDDNGNLVTGQPGGGTVDRYAPNTFTGRLKHLRHDILPYIYCCRGDFKDYTCDRYHKKRPSDDGSKFSLQPPG